MGKRGPAKTPTPILKLTGSRLADERDEHEPKPDEGWPDAPKEMTETALGVWNQLLPELEKMGVLTVVDGKPSSRYCEMYVRWWRANEFIQQSGECYPIKNADGSLKYVMQFPQVSIASKLNTALLRIEQEFGLTPSSRAGLKVANTDFSELDRLYE